MTLSGRQRLSEPLATRAPFGCDVPWYYTERGEIRTSHRIAPLKAQVDEQSLAFWIAGLDPPDPGRTLFQDVRRLLPCESLSSDRRIVRDVPSSSHGSWLEGSPDVLAREVRDVLFRAVDRATHGHRKVAVLLGGLDSSAVLAVLTRLRPADTIHAITVDFPGHNPDRPYAEALCRQLGVRWTVVEAKQWEPLQRFMLLDAKPYGMLYGGGELAAYLAAADVGAELALTAIIGDVVFGGYAGHLGSHLMWRKPLEALRLALRVEMPEDYGVVDRLRRFLVGPAVREVIPKAIRVARARRQWRGAMPWATPRFHDLLSAGVDICWRRYALPATPNDAFREWATSAELGELGESCDLLAGEAGIGWCEVTADPELVQLLCAIPIERLFDGDRFRGLLRRAVSDILPEPALSRRSKAEFRATASDLSRADDRALLNDLARGETLAKRGLVRSAELRHAFERAESHFWMWRFLAAEAFLREYS